jgi:poly(ADP-ribose) glycohydrolase ARH3
MAWPQLLPDTLPEEVLRDRVRGCLLWGAAGDALGRPLNRLSPEEIRTRFGREGLTRYLPPLDWRSGPKGAFTGVTSLTVEVARSLVASNGHLKPEDFAQRLVDWQRNRRQVDPATAEAIQRIAAGLPWWSAGGRALGDCGAAVRVAPVGLAHALDAAPLELRQAAVLAALPTHSDAAAVAGSVALAAGVAWLVREVARGAERVDAAALTRFVAAAVAGIEPPAADGAPQLVQRLRDLPSVLAQASVEQVFARSDQGASALDAVPSALYHFLRSPDDPRQVVLAAANAGNNASAVASMAGQLAGAWCGAERLWRDAAPWWDDLEDRDELRGLADQLCALTLKGTGR